MPTTRWPKHSTCALLLKIARSTEKLSCAVTARIPGTLLAADRHAEAGAAHQQGAVGLARRRSCARLRPRRAGRRCRSSALTPTSTTDADPRIGLEGRCAGCLCTGVRRHRCRQRCAVSRPAPHEFSFPIRVAATACGCTSPGRWRRHRGYRRLRSASGRAAPDLGRSSAVSAAAFSDDLQRGEPGCAPIGSAIDRAARAIRRTDRSASSMVLSPRLAPPRSTSASCPARTASATSRSPGSACR